MLRDDAMMRSPLRRWVAIGACLLAASVALPTSVSAHAFLAQSSPQAGERLRTSPHTLILEFTEEVAPASSDTVTLRNAAGQPVHIGSLVRSTDGTALTAALPSLPNGVYIVTWQDVSASDGHPSAGEFAFAIGRGGALPAVASRSSTATDWPAAIASWLFLLGLAVGVGWLTSERFVWRPLLQSQSVTPSPAPLRGAVLVAAIAAAALFVVFARSLAGAGAGSGLDPRTWSVALQTRVGVLALIAAGLALYALLTLFATRTRNAALISLMVAAVAAALRSHPAATRTWWGTLAVVFHVTLAIVWAGLLAHLVVVLWRRHAQLPPEIVQAAVRRYARLALGSVIVILLSGLGAALAELTAVSQLLTTTYGRILVIKGTFVALALLLALVSRTRGLRREPAASLSLLRRLTRGEVVAVAAVLGAAALLGNVAPPYVGPLPGAAAAALLGAPPPVGPTLHLADQAGWLEVYLTTVRGQLALSVRAPDDTPAQDLRLALSARTPSGRDIDLFPRPCGAGCYSMHIAWQPGTTRLRAQVSARGWAGGIITFAVPWPPLKLNPGLFVRAITTMRAQRLVAFREFTSSGPHSTAHNTYRLSGARFMATEPYGQRVADVRGLPRTGDLDQLVVYLPGSHIWVRLWIDAQHRFRRETIVAPGFLIQRSFSYPRG